MVTRKHILAVLSFLFNCSFRTERLPAGDYHGGSYQNR